MAGDSPAPKPNLPTKPPDAHELAEDILRGNPLATTTRGVRKAEVSPALYTDNADDWPPTPDGKVVIPQICWAGLPSPLHRANLHYLIAGVPGTGKTFSIRLLLQSIFSAKISGQLPGSDRAVIYDPKQEFYPVLRGMGVGAEKVKILNPFDARCHPWDLAADYTNPAEAFQLARTMIPTPEQHSQPFFPKSAAALLAAVISVYMRRKPGAWDLADVVMACLTPGTLQKILGSDPKNPFVSVALNFLEEDTTRNNILAELSSHIFEFLPIAACWRTAKNAGKTPVSVSAFLARPDEIVLLGANQTHSEALSAVNRLLLKRLAEQTLDYVADGQWEAMNRTWLVLDEARELGKVPGLADFINKGRSRGVCAVLGFQDFAGMKHAFGENVAHELTATCAHKLFLRLGAESAEWASRSIGKAEVRETQFSRSAGTNFGANASESQGTNWGGMRGGFASQSQGVQMNFSQNITSSTTIRETDAVMASEIGHLPAFEEGGGLRGFMCQNAGENELAQVHCVAVPREFFARMMPASDDPGFVARPGAEQDLFEVMNG